MIAATFNAIWCEPLLRVAAHRFEPVPCFGRANTVPMRSRPHERKRTSPIARLRRGPRRRVVVLRAGLLRAALGTGMRARSVATTISPSKWAAASSPNAARVRISLGEVRQHQRAYAASPGDVGRPGQRSGGRTRAAFTASASRYVDSMTSMSTPLGERVDAVAQPGVHDEREPLPRPSLADLVQRDPTVTDVQPTVALQAERRPDRHADRGQSLGQHPPAVRLDQPVAVGVDPRATGGRRQRSPTGVVAIAPPPPTGSSRDVGGVVEHGSRAAVRSKYDGAGRRVVRDDRMGHPVAATVGRRCRARRGSGRRGSG